jgi:hypothetical protein
MTLLREQFFCSKKFVVHIEEKHVNKTAGFYKILAIFCDVSQRQLVVSRKLIGNWTA